jgi:hypothetical protein
MLEIQLIYRRFKDEAATLVAIQRQDDRTFVSKPKEGTLLAPCEHMTGSSRGSEHTLTTSRSYGYGQVISMYEITVPIPTGLIITRSMNTVPITEIGMTQYAF